MREWLKVHWRNGLRFQLAISILILGGVVALYLQFYNFAHREETAISIQSIAVKDTVVSVNGRLLWAQTICNDSDDPVAVSVSVHFVTAKPPEHEQIVPGQLAEVAEPGCHASTIRLTDLPALEPGQWRLRIVDTTTTAGGLLKFTTMDSAPFEVIEGVGVE